MARKKVSTAEPAAKPDEYPKVREFFGAPSSWEIGRLGRAEASCFNGVVSVERYQIRVEKIDEPDDVIETRLKKLWRESEPNIHVRHPIRAYAMQRFGWDHNRAVRELPSEDQGKDFIPRSR